MAVAITRVMRCLVKVTQDYCVSCGESTYLLRSKQIDIQGLAWMPRIEQCIVIAV